MEVPEHWTKTDDMLRREFGFTNFQEALDFVVAVGEIAEQQQHHPDIHLVNYKSVVIETTTHDEGNSVTEKDLELARLINESRESL